jgi:hypothetical protein
MDGDTILVSLHIYDLTRGMARMMSAAILGNSLPFHVDTPSIALEGLDRLSF